MPLRWVGRALEPVRELVLVLGLVLGLGLVQGLVQGLGCRPRRCRQWRR